MTNDQIDFTVNRDNLYREENIIDMQAASIRCFTPINPDGSIDERREKIFFGHTQLMSPQGPVPLLAPLNASTLEEAMENFPAAMKQAMGEMIEEIKKMQQEQERSRQSEDSRIIVPGEIIPMRGLLDFERPLQPLFPFLFRLFIHRRNKNLALPM